jgi:hypothetical protein
MVLQQQLILTTINTAKSAFFAVTFFSSFFDTYSIASALDKVQASVLLKVGRCSGHPRWSAKAGTCEGITAFTVFKQANGC